MILRHLPSKTIRFSALALSALFLTASLTPSASAFLLLMGGTYAKGERPVAVAPVWQNRVLKFVVNTNLSAMGGSTTPLITGSELLAAAQAAVSAWNAACRADIQIEISGTTSGSFNTSDRVNTIVWDRRTTGEGNYYGNQVSTLAAATTVIAGDEFADCDIVLNGNASTVMAFSPMAGQADLRSIITHEIGHCLGLDHPIDPTGTPAYTSTNTYVNIATMRQTAALPSPDDTSRRVISQDDRDGVECMYERGKPFRGGLHCASYSGSNGQGEVSGSLGSAGPTGVDTACSGEAQGRNANPSSDSGDGCAPTAVASERAGVSAERPFELSRVLSGTWGFILFAILFHFTRRWLRRARA